MKDDFNDPMDEFKSILISRNITILGRRTSVRLEPEMWNSLKEISRREKCKIHDICSLIHLRKNPHTSLTAAIRVFLMLYYRAAATEDGHTRAGHGNFENMIVRARMKQELLQKDPPSDTKNLASYSVRRRYVPYNARKSSGAQTDSQPYAGF